MKNKLKVLAVDDNSISLAAIEQELKETYEVIPLNSGGRALQYLKRERPDLILLDIQMEGKDG
ncbi:MAG: response regulator, partial [Lachnospiraceae bacterium]|nr:response regulator [Lachnospiraceae bacterium]